MVGLITRSILCMLLICRTQFDIRSFRTEHDLPGKLFHWARARCSGLAMLERDAQPPHRSNAAGIPVYLRESYVLQSRIRCSSSMFRFVQLDFELESRNSNAESQSWNSVTQLLTWRRRRTGRSGNLSFEYSHVLSVLSLCGSEEHLILQQNIVHFNFFPSARWKMMKNAKPRAKFQWNCIWFSKRSGRHGCPHRVSVRWVFRDLDPSLSAAWWRLWWATVTRRAHTSWFSQWSKTTLAGLDVAFLRYW